MVRVPAKLEPARPAPLVIACHGAGGNPEHMLDILGSAAEDRGILVLAPQSRGSTWDAIREAHGEDALTIDRSLEALFAAIAVEPQHIAIAGFSDGASYALSLGLANGMLFSDVLAFSPGFIPAAPRLGRPRVFLSHGRADTVLPIAPTSRRIVAGLTAQDYEVEYMEFPGGHTVPEEAIARALTRFLG